MLTLNVAGGSSDWRAHALSNFPCFPFQLDDVLCASPEGFIQGIKYPIGDPRRKEIFELWGKKAKDAGADAKREFVWWNEDEIPYGTTLHHVLIGRAIRAKFYYNTGARIALRSTKGLTLLHDVGPESPHTSLPWITFTAILTELRDELERTGELKPP